MMIDNYDDAQHRQYVCGLGFMLLCIITHSMGNKSTSFHKTADLCGEEPYQRTDCDEVFEELVFL